MSGQLEKREFYMYIHTEGGESVSAGLQQNQYTEQQLRLAVGMVMVMDLDWRQADRRFKIFVPKEEFSRMVWNLPMNSEIDFAIMGTQSLTITRLG